MTAARRTLDQAMNEQAWQQQVIDLARLCGWRIHHTRAAINRRGQWSTPTQGDPGYPDLTLAHPDGLVVIAELKTERGKVGPDQHEWIRLLDDSSELAVEVWRPHHWGHVEQVLRGRRT